MEFGNMEEVVTIFACRIEGQNGTWYWKDRSQICDPKVGEWVIVENGNSYSLAQVIGIVECPVSQVHRFANNGYDKVKNIVANVNLKVAVEIYNQKIEAKKEV